MAPPNQLFSPILTTCMCTSVLLLLLLLFLLYKYNQVSLPVAQQGLQGLPSFRGNTASVAATGKAHAPKPKSVLAPLPPGSSGT